MPALTRLPENLLKYWPRLLALVLLVLLCWQLAHWTWRLATPEPPPAMPALPAPAPESAVAASQVAAAHLFGQAAQAPAPAVQTVVPTTLNVKLKGVFAARGRLPAYAILNPDNKGDLPVRVGSEVTPGVILDSVHPGFVLLRRGANLERVELGEKPAAPVGGLPGAPPAGAAPAVPPAGAPPTGAAFNLGVTPTGQNRFSFSRNELNLALQDPRQLGNLGQIEVTPGGGVTVREVPPGSLAERLGLRRGDVIRQVNGIPVGSQEDLAKLYQQFSQVGQIALEGTRAGRPLKLNYTVQQ